MISGWVRVDRAILVAIRTLCFRRRWDGWMTGYDRQIRDSMAGIERCQAMSLTFQPMDEVSARAILTWRYEVPYDLYNLEPRDAEAAVQFFLDPQNGYQSITDEQGELVAYCCFGLDAQVPGGDYDMPALDIGLGVRPDLTGQGRGLGYVRATLGVAQRTIVPDTFRVTVAEFNERAQKVWRRAGFRPVQRFVRPQDGRPFVILLRKATVNAPQPGDS